MIKQTKLVKTVHEAVGVFSDAYSLQAALDDLQGHGFMHQELSILADDKTVREGLSHIYSCVEDAKDDAAAPRTIFVPNETMSEAKGIATGFPFYIAAVTATGVVVASGGTLLNVIITATAAGAVGAVIGSVFSGLIEKHHANFIQDQIDKGELLLWVSLRSPDRQETAKDILSRHAAHDVHIHEFPLYG